MTKRDLSKNTSQIWHLLITNKCLSIKKLEEMTHAREAVIFIALGSLMNEDKIQLNEKGGVLEAQLNALSPENYY